MKNCIVQQGLSCLDVADKFIALTPQGWKVFAKEIKGSFVTGARRMSRLMVEQLLILARKTGFCDWVTTNWIWKENENVIVCIDTGTNSFDESQWESLEELRYYWGKAFPEKTLASLKEEIKTLTHQDQKANLKKYDDPDIIFDQVIEEFSRFKEKSDPLKKEIALGNPN